MNRPSEELLHKTLENRATAAEAASVAEWLATDSGQAWARFRPPRGLWRLRTGGGRFGTHFYTDQIHTHARTPTPHSFPRCCCRDPRRVGLGCRPAPRPSGRGHLFGRGVRRIRRRQRPAHAMLVPGRLDCLSQFRVENYLSREVRAFRTPHPARRRSLFQGHEKQSTSVCREITRTRD